MIQIARNLTSGFSEIEIRQADILDLRDEGWESDVVLCSLALHHFSGEDAIRVLETMNRLSALGFIVNELNRHWFAAWCGWTYAHLTTRNPITRNDTYVSFLRAFTSSELASMARRAGVAYFQIHHEPMFRLVLVGEH
jgi:2-polyprenyl-3-methyl-5-hydroxy-6-metoxy-1,4-benzoquinol methylase